MSTSTPSVSPLQSRTAARWTLVVALLVLALAIMAWAPGGASLSSARSTPAPASTSAHTLASFPPPPTPTVITFNETGLPASTYWSVTFNGTSNSTSTLTYINFTVTVARGTVLPYSILGGLGYTAQQVYGNETVGGFGASNIVPVVFLPPGTYGLTFSATGLGFGATATVTVTGIGTMTFPPGGFGGAPVTVTFNVTNATYAWNDTPPTYYISTPGTGSVTITGADQTVDLVFAPNPNLFPVTFTERGLARGTTWGLTFNGTYCSSAGAGPCGAFGGGIPFEAGNGTWAFNVSTVTGYTASPATGNETVAGAAVDQTIIFTPVGEYSLTFNETGLPTGTRWSIVFNGTTERSTATSSDIIFAAADGTYAWTVNAVATYIAVPAAGNLTVSGTPTNPVEVINFVPASSYFKVTFTETGLPGGDWWTVELNGVTNAATQALTTSFEEPNGTSYAFSVTTNATGETPNPATGTLGVAGAPVNQAITFSSAPPKTYQVTFTESGLTAGTQWTLTFGTTPHTSTTSSLVVASLAPGTYSYFYVGLTGFTLSPSGTQSLTISNANLTEAATYTAIAPATFTVTFTESGLPSGTTWSVTLNTSVEVSGATSSITSNLVNGSYTYTVTAVSGYTATPTSGSFSVAGAAVPAAGSISFKATSGGGTGPGGGSKSTTNGGLSGSDLDLIILAIVVILVVAVVAVLMMRRRGGSSAPGGPMAAEAGAGATGTGGMWSQPDDGGLPPAGDQPPMEQPPQTQDEPAPDSTPPMESAPDAGAPPEAGDASAPPA